LRLLIDDILVSNSGSIGKTAVVRSKSSPLVASKSVIVIRPKEGLFSGYLSSLLQSEPYQTWLTGHARGATVQHLSVRTLSHLVIPVPNLQLQQRVATACESRRADALALLLEFITGTRRDPVTEWLESDPAVRAILQPDLEENPAQLRTLLE